MRITQKTSLWVAAVAVLTSLPAFAGEGDAGVVRISDSGQRQTVRGQSPAKRSPSPIKRTSYQGCTDGSCAAAPVADPVFSRSASAAPCGPGGCPTSGSAGSSGRGGIFGGNGGMFGSSNRGNGSIWNGSSSRSSGSTRSGSSAGNRSSSRLAGAFGGSNGSSNGGLTSGLRNGSSKVTDSASRWWQGQLAMRRARTARSNQALKSAFCPSGNCGNGSPLAGHYNLVYAADPNYFDQRDGSLYSAQGYGTPVTVPLAPNVHHQFNYGWGMPSSRITQISTPAGYSVQRPIHW